MRTQGTVGIEFAKKSAIFFGFLQEASAIAEEVGGVP
jgi:hypothetical protein